MNDHATDPRPSPASTAPQSRARRPGCLGSFGRLARAVGSAAATFALGLALWLLHPGTGAPPASGQAAPWGAEAAFADDRASGSGALAWLPLAPANACGLGASSCFKCHNGKRAAAPASDATKAPWHAQHAKVNNSCVGCHKGNPRVMKEDVAHTKMVAKPRDNTTDSCGSCHSADLARVQGAYKGK